MQYLHRSLQAFTLLTFCSIALHVRVQGAAVGPFEDQIEIGAPHHAGSVEFATARRTYTVAGGGANMWFTNDAFHFVWKKVSGDATLAADISFLGQGGDPHRKAC